MRGRRVYFDAMIFIYLIEGYSELQDRLFEIRDSLLKTEAKVFTSELTICETLVVPFRNNDVAMVSKYREFIEDSGAFEVLPAHRATWIRASLYRAQFGLKTPDAVHVASAVEAGCELFVTNDKLIKSPKGIKVASLRTV